MAREILKYNDRYKGSLTDDECNILEQLLTLDAQNGYVPELKHIIFNLSDEEVDTIIKDKENSGIASEFERDRGTLRNEQTIGVALLYYAKNAILGDSVGMGKTVETAGLTNLLKTSYLKENQTFRYLLLTEKNIAPQVRREMVKFTGDYVELIPSGEQKIMDKFIESHPYFDKLENNVVGTHSLLTTSAFLGWLETCRTEGQGFPFDLLVVDESSVLGNAKTNIANGFKAISKYFSRIVFLNATPFETKLDIFYTQLSLLDAKMLPARYLFNQEYCEMDYRGMYPKPSGKYKNQDQFRRLIGYRYFARTRRDKGAVMEDCYGEIVVSPLSKVQKEWMKLSQLHRMVYDCPNRLDPTIKFNEDNVPKLGSLRTILNEICAPDDQVLIFVHYKEAQTSLSQWLTENNYTNKILNGDTVNAERNEIITGFKKKEYRVLLTNVQKGLNFGDCNYCIFYSFDPNPSKMIQFEGRTTRSFDIKGKNVYILRSEGKELKQLNETVKQRAKATSELSNTDISVIMDILLKGFN